MGCHLKSEIYSTGHQATCFEFYNNDFHLSLSECLKRNTKDSPFYHCCKTKTMPKGFDVCNTKKFKRHFK